MGYYLNSTAAFLLYQDETKKPYFVDKTRILSELIPLVETGGNHICLTRPRRFGKTIMANMIAAYFSKGSDSHSIFDRLAISQSVQYREYLNQFDVIHISFNEMDFDQNNYAAYIKNIKKLLQDDLRESFPEVNFSPENEVLGDLRTIFARTGRRFIFVLDEWDYIFHQNFVSEEDKKNYLSFLRNLLKDKPYVQFAYMTGILPIAKYSSGSELNMFREYTMATKEKFSGYFGFSDDEVDLLYDKYLKLQQSPKVTREGLRIWYDGYQTLGGIRIYNPRSVVFALEDNQLSSYWTTSGPYDEIYYYVEHNIADIRDDLAVMISDIPVQAKIQEYAATSMNLQTRDEIFSAMVVYGFLSYEKGKVRIPNKELMDKFTDMLRKESSFGYIYRLAKNSEQMLQATIQGDTETMQKILAFAHDTEIPLLSYNNETELTALVNLVYLAARDNYRIEREDKAGIGYVDFIFYPETDKSADCIILELKVDSTPDQAIMQIQDRKYALRFQPKPGEKKLYTGHILAVGIAYDKKTKQHQCKVVVLR